MSSKPRIALIGCGAWGRNHARTLAELGVLGKVADRHDDRAEDYAREFGVEAIAPDQVIADAGIDGVVLALPPQYHAELGCRLLQAGKHVLVEKPIALNVADGEKLVAAAKSTGRIAMVGHVLRYHAAFQHLLSLTRDNALGNVRYIHAHRIGLGRFLPATDALWDLAPHDLSLVLAIADEEPDRVRGEGTAVLEDQSDFAHLHLGFPSGLRAHVFASRLNPYRERRLTVVGDRGMAIFDDMEPWERKLALYRHEVSRIDGQLFGKMVEPDYIPLSESQPLKCELQAFLEAIKTGSPPLTPAEDGLKVLRILEAGTVRHG